MKPFRAEAGRLFRVGAPGALVFTVIWALAMLLGARELYPGSRGAWQHLSQGILTEDYWRSLLLLHIQPPGFNAIIGAIDRTGDLAGGVWLLLGFVLGLVTVVLAAHSVLLMTGSRVTAVATGLALGALPTLVLYGLWPTYTHWVAGLVVVAVWGVALAAPRPVWAGTVTAPAQVRGGLIVSALAATSLFLIRSTFVWVLVLAWLVFLLLLGRRASEPRRWDRGLALVLLGCALAVLVVQARSVVLFNSWTQSTWAGQNVYHALVGSGAVSPEDVALAIADDPCMGYLAGRGAFIPTRPDPVNPCLDVVGPRGASVDASALGEVAGEDGPYNYNSGEELLMSAGWQRLATTLIKEDPLAMGRVILGGSGVDGSLGILLTRSDTYNQVLPNWDRARAVFGKAWLYSVAWPYAVLLIPLFGVPLVALIRPLRRRTVPAYWAGVAIVGVLVPVNLVGEFGENQRFRVELDPLLGIVSAVTLWVVVSEGRRATKDRQAARAIPATLPSSTITNG